MNNKFDLSLARILMNAYLVAKLVKEILDICGTVFNYSRKAHS